MVALHSEAGAGGGDPTAALRALAGRARLVPVLCVAPGGEEAAAAAAALARLYAGVDCDLAHRVHVLRGDPGGPPALVPPGLDGVVFRELTAAGGVAQL